MAESRAAKWKTMKNKSFIRLPPDSDSLRQHCLCTNFLAYLMLHPSLKHHPSPLGHGWELVDGRCRPVRYTKPALPRHLALHEPTPEQAYESNDDESKEEDEDSDDDDVRKHGEDSSETEESGSSEAEFSDMN
ncbi:hypothetical protein ACOMHN_012988 [Nucella lapillus]